MGAKRLQRTKNGKPSTRSVAVSDEVVCFGLGSRLFLLSAEAGGPHVGQRPQT